MNNIEIVRVYQYNVGPTMADSDRNWLPQVVFVEIIRFPNAT